MSIRSYDSKFLRFFLSYTNCPSSRKVKTKGGSLLTVSGIGSLTLEPIGLLERALHTTKLCINIISVQKLARILEIQRRQQL